MPPMRSRCFAAERTTGVFLLAALSGFFANRTIVLCDRAPFPIPHEDAENASQLSPTPLLPFLKVERLVQRATGDLLVRVQIHALG